jgi:hypothetical protein
MSFAGLRAKLASKPDAEPGSRGSTAAEATTDHPDRRPDPAAPEGEGVSFALDRRQEQFFHTFGFLKVPGLFRDDVARFETGFEDVFASNPLWETHEPLHFDERRQIVPDFIKKTPLLADLCEDPRVVSIVSTLIGPDYDVLDSDGNVFSCDTSWHPDNYQAPLEIVHLKLSFYLDRLDGSSGAIRMLPGTNHWQTEYATELRRSLHDPAAIRSAFGVDPEEIPAWTIESEPGDVVIWSYRSIHASFNGGQRRRLFSLNFRAR